MGTIGTERPKGVTNRKFFEDELMSSDYVVLKDHSAGGYWYAAIQDRRTGEVFAAVVKYYWVNSRYEPCNFFYKSMDETMGPFAWDAPDALLDLLSPTGNEYALEWRSKCRENNAAKNQRRKTLKRVDLQPGDRVSIPYYPVLEEATVVDAKKSRFRGSDGVVYRVPGWRDKIVLPSVVA